MDTHPIPSTGVDRYYCQMLDQQDPLASLRDHFTAARSGTIFLDANSMGAMPSTVPTQLADFFSNAWVELRRQGWNRCEWLQRPQQIGAAIAPLIGAASDTVLACDNTTVNLFKLLAYAWHIRPSGAVILTEDGNFPTDLYVAQGLPRVLDGRPEVRICQSRAELLESITEEVAVVYLSHVDYRSSERWDMAEINHRAQTVDALTVWDLSHAAGAIPVELTASGADFAVGCGYKYLSMGPGGPAYLWMHPRHAERAWPVICGWMGHRDVFAFATEYAPLPGTPAQATGTPAVIANEVAWCAAQIWQQVDPSLLWAKHQMLSDLMMHLLQQECAALGVALNSPLDYDQRGGHISFSHAAAGPVCEALLDAGVVGSFRKPNALRFGLGALTLRFEDVWEAVARLKDILSSERWREPRYQHVSV